MKPLPEIKCASTIQAIEFISYNNLIAVSLANLTIVFYDISKTKKMSRVIKPTFKVEHELKVPHS